MPTVEPEGRSNSTVQLVIVEDALLVTVNLPSYPPLQDWVLTKAAVAADAGVRPGRSPRRPRRTSRRRCRRFSFSVSQLPPGGGNGSDAATAGLRYGRVARCGLTVRAKLLPLETSQLIDQVIAPRMPG